MDGDSVLGTDMACTGEEDDSTVGLEYDGRRRSELGSTQKWHEIQPHFLRSLQIAHIC